MSFNAGENVGPYRIMEQLGQGGMATVYKAYHAALDRYVALKALKRAFSAKPAWWQSLSILLLCQSMITRSMRAGPISS